MEIKGKAHLFFEQSGTFKNEFIKLGIPAFDYDIQNNFGETDFQIDLFAEIEKAFDNQPSIYDSITTDDIIIAFFPCVYFCAPSQMNFTWGCINYRCMTVKQKTLAILERSQNREKFWALAIKMLTVAEERGLRLIMENPWSEQTYLKSNFVLPPALIDTNRRLRGDYFTKPTAFWFINCNPEHGFTPCFNPVKMTQQTSRGSGQAGLCSEERSMMSPEYARNFICDFVLGKVQKNTQLRLFD
jgi:hypothetical protein